MFLSFYGLADLRRRAWHKLLGINRCTLDQTPHNDLVSSLEGITPQDIELVSREVGRSVYFRYKATDGETIHQSTSLEYDNDDMSLLAGVKTSSYSSTGSPLNSVNSTSSTSSFKSKLSFRFPKKKGDSYRSEEEEEEEAEEDTIASLDQFNKTNSEKVHALTQIIISALVSKSTLSYYQGFHDIASVIYVNLPTKPELASHILRRLSKSHLRDAMKEDFSCVLSFLEITFFPLLQVLDEELHDYLIVKELGPTVFLNWMITLFAHDVHNSQAASRIMDALLASHQLLPLYLTMAFLTFPTNRQRIFATDGSDGAMLHATVTGLASELSHEFDPDPKLAGFTIQEMLEDAITYMSRAPPDTLQTLARDYDLGQNESLLNFGNSIALFKPPQKWALADTEPADWVQRKERKTSLKAAAAAAAGSSSSSTAVLQTAPTFTIRTSGVGKQDVLKAEKRILNTIGNTKDFPHAKIASGWRPLMNSVDPASLRTDRGNGSFNVNNPISAVKSVFGYFKIAIGVKKSSRRGRIGS